MNTPAQPGPEQFALRCAERAACAALLGLLDVAWVAQAGWDEDRGIYYLHAAGQAEVRLIEASSFGAFLLQLKDLPGLGHIGVEIGSWRVKTPPSG